MSRRRLIAERDILRAHRAGERVVAVGNGIVTPAARDAAARLGLDLVADQPSTVVRKAGARRGGSARVGAVAPAASTSSAPDAHTRAPGETGDTRPGAPAAARTWTRVVLGADHGGVALKDVLLAYLRDRGATVQDVGTFGAEAVDYPDFAVAVAQAVASGAAQVGIMVDGAGIGSCMAANKVAGVRAALCYDVTTAANAREHNDANVLTLGGTLVGPRLAQEIVRTFLDTPFAGGRHARRVEKIDALDARRARPDDRPA